MAGRRFWHSGRALLLGAALVAGSTGVMAIAPGASVPVAEAGVAQGKDKDDKDRRESKKNKGDDGDQDHVLNGQVLEINTLKDPPELVVGSVDGQTVVRVLKTDEIAINGVRLGDYVELDGEKLDETVFEATQIAVAERYSDVSNDDEVGKKDRNNKKSEDSKKN